MTTTTITPPAIIAYSPNDLLLDLGAHNSPRSRVFPLTDAGRARLGEAVVAVTLYRDCAWEWVRRIEADGLRVSVTSTSAIYSDEE